MFGLLFGAGCGERPTTTAKDVLTYIRNAQVGAVVRRLDPECQAYVDSVMESYGAYQAASEPHGKSRGSQGALGVGQLRLA